MLTALAKLRSGIPVLALVLAATACLADERGFIRLTPDEMHWTPVVEGIDVHLLEGNPAEEGLYILRVRFGPGAMSRPHTHDRDRYVTVIEGVWYTGTQAEFDPNRTVGLKAGSYMKHPAGAVHYDGAKGEAVVVEIRGIGPVATQYISSDDAPD